MQGVPKNVGLSPTDVLNYPLQCLYVLEAGSSEVSVPCADGVCDSAAICGRVTVISLSAGGL